MTFLRPVIVLAAAIALCMNGLWIIVGIACCLWLLLWLGTSGTTMKPPVSQLRRRQIDRYIDKREVEP